MIDVTMMFLSLVGFYVSIWNLTKWVYRWLKEESE